MPIATPSPPVKPSTPANHTMSQPHITPDKFAWWWGTVRG